VIIYHQQAGASAPARIYNSPMTGIVLILIFLFLPSVKAQERVSQWSGRFTSHEVHVVEEAWHSGIVIENDEQARSVIPALNDFIWADYVDIGWGDEDFYQSPDIDYWLGAKALLINTPSVVRIAGYKGSKEPKLRRADAAMRFELNGEQYRKMLFFIARSFSSDTAGTPQTIARQANGGVIFYRSVLYYNMFNTCNTWVGKAFKQAGFDVNTFMLLTKGQLMERLQPFGTPVESNK